MRTLTALVSISALAITAGCIGNIGGDTNPTAPPADPLGFSCDPKASALTASPIRRLPKTYFENSVRELLSPLDDSARAALLASIQTRFDLIPTDNSDFYIENDSTLSQDHVDAIFGVALALASKVSDTSTPYESELLALCGPGSTESSLSDDVCLTKFVTYYGRKAFRRPLTQPEIDDFKGFYQQAVSQGVDGLAMLIGRFVGHPNFYYRYDADGSQLGGTEGTNATYRLSKWELLSKITFLFWAAPPTDELYDRVDATDITSDADLSALIDDVLADPKTEQGILGFYREWLQLDLAKTPGTEGNVIAGQAMLAAAGINGLPPTYKQDMIQEVIDLTKYYTLSTNGKLSDILTSPYSFAKTPELAKIYNVAPWDGTRTNLVSLPPSERSGLLTRAAFVSSSSEYTRPVIKGKLARTRILCTDIAPPPPNLNIKPLTHPVDQTTRQALDIATADPACQSCHSQMNPIGYLTENYDPTGRIRTKELRFVDNTGTIAGSLDIDTTGDPGVGADHKPLANGVDLGAAIALSGVADSCMVLNYFEFVTGRVPDKTTDGCDVVHMTDRLTAGDGSIKSMLRESVMQQSFRQRLVK